MSPPPPSALFYNNNVWLENNHDVGFKCLIGTLCKAVGVQPGLRLRGR